MYDQEPIVRRYYVETHQRLCHHLNIIPISSGGSVLMWLVTITCRTVQLTLAQEILRLHAQPLRTGNVLVLELSLLTVNTEWSTRLDIITVMQCYRFRFYDRTLRKTKNDCVQRWIIKCRVFT